MESVTYMKDIRISPKKMRFYIPEIKKMSPSQAVDVLLYNPSKPGRIFYKAIKSAISNAKQTLKVSDDLLQFKTLLIEEGQKMKRYQPAGRGTANTIKKKFSHIKIVLVTKSEPVLSKEPVETEKKKEEKAIEASAEVKTPKRKTAAKSVKKAKKEDKSK